MTKRKLSADTLRRYGYFLGSFNGQPVQVAPYHDQQGVVVAQKLRFADKGSGMPVLKGEGFTSLHDCQLFGQHLFGGKDRLVVVTEGEIDAMSVFQALGGKQAVVSVQGGAAGAKKGIQRNLLWLMNFDTVVLFFDNDEAGRVAVEECAPLFQGSGTTVKVARIEGTKDASEALQKNRPGDITQAVYGSSVWSKPGILSARDVLSRVDFDAPPPRRYSTPWPHLTDVLYGGLSEADVIFILSGAGKGKSTVLFELINHLMEAEKAAVGAMFFEDTLDDIVHGLLTVRTNQRLRLDPGLVKSEVKKEEWGKIANSDLLHLFDGENAKWGVGNLLDYVRYLAKGCGCRWILVDPLSFLIAQSDERDERRAIDAAVAALASLAKQLGVGIIITHHLTRPEGDKGHEEGADIALKQARGSNGIGQFCTLALGLRWRPDAGVTEVKCLKSRKQGELSGKTLTWLQYQPDTGRVAEVPEPQTAEGSGGDGGSSSDDF